jgi:hypothetical protein
VPFKRVGVLVITVLKMLRGDLFHFVVIGDGGGCIRVSWAGAASGALKVGMLGSNLMWSGCGL